MSSKKSFKAHFKQHMLLAYPMIVSRISIILISIADHIMIGNLGVTSLAALALAEAVIWPFFSFCIGVSYGIIPLVAAASAKHNYKKSTKILKHALVVNTILGTLVCMLIVLASPIIHYIGQASSVANLVEAYLRLTAVSLVPFMLFWTLKDYIIGLSFTKKAMYINIFGSLVHIILNYVFIYGQLGMPAMGFLGAGWGVLVSHSMRALIIGSYIYITKLKSYLINFNLKGFIYPYFIKILKIGIPASLGLMLEAAIYASLGIMVGWINTETQAAYTIANNLNDISSIALGGIAMATTIQVGKQFGMRDFFSLRKAGLTGFIIGGLLLLFSLLVLALGGSSFPTYYTNNTSVLNMATSLVVIVGILELLDGIIEIGIAALRGMEDTTIPFVITMISRCMLGLPLGYLLCFKLGWGAQGIWWGLGITQSFSLAAIFIRFHRKSKELTHIGG